MDPRANIQEQVLLARELREDSGDGLLSVEDIIDKADRLAELVLALHEWRQKGGFDPYGV